MTATTGHLVRSSHPEDDAQGRVFAPGDVVPDLDTSDPFNKEKIEAGVFYKLAENEDAPEGGGSAGPDATDAAVKLANENDIDLSDIIGSGKDNRITQEDVQDAVDAKEDEDDDDEEGDE